VDERWKRKNFGFGSVLILLVEEVEGWTYLGVALGENGTVCLPDAIRDERRRREEGVWALWRAISVSTQVESRASR